MEKCDLEYREERKADSRLGQKSENDIEVH
jgi:hypothetical protein